VSGQQHATAELYPRLRGFTGGWWDTGPVWMGGISRPHRDWIPERPGHSQPLYLSIINTGAACLVTNFLTSITQPKPRTALRLVDVPPADEILCQMP